VDFDHLSPGERWLQIIILGLPVRDDERELQGK
jgi:hypothetical protein